MALSKKKKYLQIALNSTMAEAKSVIKQIPLDERIIIEAGTPLIKNYGAKAIEDIRFWWEARFTPAPKSRQPLFFGRQPLNRQKKIDLPFQLYIVADLKCMDRGKREVEIAAEAGANAAVGLGQAPIETIDCFIEECQKNNLDSMVDMMNVEFPLSVLRQLKKLPDVVMLHRGADEEEFNPEKEIPYHEIARVKSEYDILISVAGGDEFHEVQRAIFNDADIVVAWKSFFKSTNETARLAEQFLREIR